MNKSGLISAMCEKTNLSKKDTESALNAFIEIVEEELIKGERVQLVGFGTFEVQNRAARVCRNPSTGEDMTIRETRVPKFKVGKALKDAIR